MSSIPSIGIDPIGRGSSASGRAIVGIAETDETSGEAEAADAGPSAAGEDKAA